MEFSREKTKYEVKFTSAMKKDMNMSSFADTGNFTLSYATEHEKPRRIVHQGDKAVYVEKNEGIINIS